MSQEFPVLREAEQRREIEQPKIKHMLVFRVRHGDTEYKEQLKGEMEDDLTEKGKTQIGMAADLIISRINPEKDIVWVISSPRVRTLDSKAIIEEKLRGAGIDIWDGSRITQAGGVHDATAQRIRNFDLMTDGSDAEQEVVDPGDERYPGIFKKVVADLESESEEAVASQQALLSSHPQLEGAEDRIRRTRNQLTYLMRVARQIQPKIEKRIVIIQTEHTESMDDLVEHATKGARTEKTMTGISKGGVIEMRLPTDPKDNEIGIVLLDGKTESFQIGYDSDTRQFTEPYGSRE